MLRAGLIPRLFLPSFRPKRTASPQIALRLPAELNALYAALPIPGNRPILIRRRVLKIATANMKFTAIGISKDDDGKRYLNVSGTDKKNPKIRRRYSFKDQDVHSCKNVIARWVRTQKRVALKVAA